MRRSRWQTLTAQSVLLAACVVLLGQFAWNFPFPAPIVRPFLEPKDRWPEEQIRAWAKTSEFPGEFWSFFTRDPDRTVPPGDDLVAPADGLVRFLDRAGDKLFMVIALSFWDVHVVRFPCDGVVTGIEDGGDTIMDKEGIGMVYLEEKHCPVQKIVDLRTKWGEIRIRLITSLSARRLEVWVEKGAKVFKGQRLGRILAGSTVVLDLPDSLPIRAKIGDRVVGGETVVSGRRVR